MKYMNNPQAEKNMQVAKELPFDIFQKVANLEWDTLLFFYGVMVGVGGLSFIGYLEVASHHLYGEYRSYRSEYSGGYCLRVY